MRIVSIEEEIWQNPGIGSGDCASVLGMSPYRSPQQFWKDLKMKIFDCVQGSPEWHSWRNTGIGASESAAALGISRYQSPLELWKEKVGQTNGADDNPNMRRGRELEPEARRIYNSVTGLSAVPLCAVHDSYDWMKASLDGWVGEKSLVIEIKCPTDYNHERNLAVKEVIAPGYEGPKISDMYWCQIQHQLAVTGGKLAHFVSYCPAMARKSEQWHLVKVLPDLKFQEWMVEKLAEFWGYVKDGITPPKSFPL